MRTTLERLTGARGAGTEAEFDARAWVRDELSQLGLETAEEPVTYDPWLFRVGLSIVLVLIAAALTGALLVPGGGWALGIVFALGLPVVSAVMWGRPRWDSGDRVRSANLVATRGVPRVWVVAHLDTKSQNVSFVARSVTAGIAVLGILGFAVGRLLGIPVVAVGFGGLTVFALLVLAASGHGDRSPGANDNASGVALLLELARRLRDESDVGFVVPTGEEDGLVGADRFVRARDELVEDGPVRDRPVNDSTVNEGTKPFVVNLDTVGCPPLLITGHRLRTRHRGAREAHLHDVITRSASDLPHRRRAIPFPAAVDSFVFHRAGYPALTLAGGSVANTYRHIHRPSDTVDRLDLEWMGRVATALERGVRELVGVAAS